MTIDWDDPGVFLTREALAEGYDDRAIWRMVRDGIWHRIRRGAYVASSTWNQADATARHRLTARAVLLAAHPTAVLTHASAVAEHDAALWGVDLSEVHVTRTDARPGRREAGVVHHRGHLLEPEVEIRHGLRVVSAARSVLELTTMTSVEASLVSANWLLGSGATTTEELESMLRRTRHWPNSLRSDLVLRLADGRNAWPGEARASYLLWWGHLPQPEPQYVVRDLRGRVAGIVDFAWPKFRVFLEFDGQMKYDRLRRPGESLEDVIRREKRRQEEITLLTGWVCIRITWADLARPAETTRRIRQLLESRRPLAS